jgi:hypothetical protein
MEPHDIQILAVLRLLGFSSSKEALENHLIQIGTGEGKSLVLALTAIILALFCCYANIRADWNTIRCACYSGYLTQRDFEIFQPLY